MDGDFNPLCHLNANQELSLSPSTLLQQAAPSPPRRDRHHARMAPGSSSEGRGDNRSLPPEPRALGASRATMQSPGK